MFELEDVLTMLRDGRSHRKQFSQSSGVQKSKSRPTFSVPFDNGLIRHVEDGTGEQLRWNDQYQQFYCFLSGQQEISKFEEWEAEQGTRIFIRNLLFSTTALDTNFKDNQSGQKTECGNLEEAAKHLHLATAIESLAQRASLTVEQISYLHECKVVAPVPAMSEKGFDLPTTLSEMIAVSTGKKDLSGSMILNNKAKSSKDCAIEDKWDVWNSASLEVDADEFRGQSVILVDDKYQSGINMHYIARQLLSLGAKKVHGLVMVKTLRDTDNLDVIET